MLIILGVALWSALHFIPVMAIPLRQKLISSLGEKAYAALFSVGILIAIALIVTGWRAQTPTLIYVLPLWVRPIGILLMLLSFILFGAAHYPTSIKRIVRHPMLTGMLVWSVSHLLTNGDQRSVVLFGGLGVWAIVQIIATNRRDGAYHKPEPVPITAEIRGAVISLLIFAVVVFLHPYFTGMPIVPRG